MLFLLQYGDEYRFVELQEGWTIVRGPSAL